MNFYIILILELTSTFCLCNSVNFSPNFIQDFLLSLGKPAKVISFLCWDTSKIIELVRVLSKVDIPFLNNKNNLDLVLHRSEYVVFLTDNKCENYGNILVKASKKFWLKSPYKWLLFNSSADTLNTDLNLYLDSLFYTVTIDEDGFYKIQAPYRLSPSIQEYIIQDFGIWHENGGFKFFKPINIGRHRNDLKNLLLNVSFVVTRNSSILHLEDYREPEIDWVFKLNFILSKLVINTMHANVRYVLRGDWGRKNVTTGKWEGGIIGDLATGAATFSAVPAFMFVDRLPYLDYLEETTSSTVAFIFKAPPLSQVTNIYTQPFDTFLWYASFLLIVIKVAVIYFIVHMEWKVQTWQDNMPYVALNPLRDDVLDVTLVEIGAVCQQGSETLPRSIAGRIAMVFMFLTVIFMYVSYSAKIVALLQSTAESIRTIEDMLHTNIKVGVEQTPYTDQYLLAVDDLGKKFIDTKLAPNGKKDNFINLELGVQKLRREFYAFHTEVSGAYRLIGSTFEENEKCSLREVRFIKFTTAWQVTGKNSTYKELIQIGYRKMKEYGLYRRIYKKFNTEKPRCEQSGSISVNVGVLDCYFAFMIFGVGVLIAVALFFIEKFIYSCKRRVQQQKLDTTTLDNYNFVNVKGIPFAH